MGTRSPLFVVVLLHRSDFMRKVILTPEFAHYPRDWHFSPGIDTGDFVFLSGITGTRPDHTIAADPERQVRDAFSFVRSNLLQAGIELRNIVEITTYYVDSISI